MEGNKLQKSHFDVLGLCCSSEVRLIENIVKSLDGVKDFSVVVPTKTLTVVHDSHLVSQAQIGKRESLKTCLIDHIYMYILKRDDLRVIYCS